MNKDAMAAMSADELDRYGRVLGIEMKPARTKAQKIALITSKRERSATVTALGMQFEVPAKALSDKRLNDILGKPEHTDGDILTALELLIGPEQLQDLADACTDEDGTVDAPALALAFVMITESGELKNS